jgi:hypothetical protein
MPMSKACSLIVMSYKNLLKPASAPGNAWQSFIFSGEKNPTTRRGRK